jgi:taurine dioxygenase
MQFDAACMRFGRTEWLALVRTRRFVDRLDALPRSVHPMVYRQAGAERPVLHVSSWFAQRIVGHDYAAGKALLNKVIACCTDPSLAHFHRWQPDDYVLWDNWRMMHCATGVPVGERRHLQRVGIAGDYGFGRMEDPAIPAEPVPVV